jgi:hypothetical protein
MLIKTLLDKCETPCFYFKSAVITHFTFFLRDLYRAEDIYTVKNDNQLSPVLGRKSGMSLIKTLAGKTSGLSWKNFLSLSGNFSSLFP